MSRGAAHDVQMCQAEGTWTGVLRGWSEWCVCTAESSEAEIWGPLSHTRPAPICHQPGMSFPLLGLPSPARVCWLGVADVQKTLCCLRDWVGLLLPHFPSGCWSPTEAEEPLTQGPAGKTVELGNWRSNPRSSSKMGKGSCGRARREQKVWPRERCLWINQLAKARSLGR